MATKSLTASHEVQIQPSASADPATLPLRSSSTSSHDEPITPLAKQPSSELQQLHQLLTTAQWEPSVEAVARVRPSVRAKLQDRLSSEEGTPPALRKAKPAASNGTTPKTKGAVLMCAW